MLQRMLLETVWGRSILVLTVTGILLRMITVLSYKRMKKAAENPATTKKQWVKLLKKRYESYERFGRVKNVGVFVEHYFSRKGILGIPLSFWDKSGLFVAVLLGLLGVIGGAFVYNGAVSGTLEGIISEAGWTGNPVTGYLFLGAIAMMTMFALHIFTDSTHTKKQILVALTDYLENGAGKSRGEEEKEEKKNPPAKEDSQALSEAAVTEEERQVLEEVLEEYFW